VARANVERLITPIRVTAGGRAGARGCNRRLLSVRIVARPTLSTVGVLRLVKIADHLSHLVAAETLFCARYESAAGRITSGKSGNVGRERVTDCTVTNCLPRHLGERDFGFFRLVTAALAACLLHRLEVVKLFAVAFDALEIFQDARVGLEMNPVSGSGRDSLPRRGVLGDVTVFAHAVGNVGVLLDFLRALGNP